jgi:hypothetical protein
MASAMKLTKKMLANLPYGRLGSVSRCFGLAIDLLQFADSCMVWRLPEFARRLNVRGSSLGFVFAFGPRCHGSCKGMPTLHGLVDSDSTKSLT